MKISPIKNASAIPIIKRIKQFFTNGKLKLRTLVADVYETHKTNYVIIDGKKVRERDLPNCVGRPSDYEGITWSEIKFYPEDEAILKTMKDARERIEYMKKLKKEGKYTLVEISEKNTQ